MVKFNYATLIALIGFYFCGYVREYIAISFFMLIHETAHILTTLAFGGEVHQLSILPIGINAVVKVNNLNKQQKLIVYSSGAIANTIMALIIFFVNKSKLFLFDFKYLFVYQNLMLALFNLLPAAPLDGGKIINEILFDRVGYFYAKRIERTVTVIMIGIISLPGFYQLISNNNISLLMIAIFLCFSLKNTQMEDSLMNMKNILYRRSKMQKKGIYPARELAVLKTTALGEILKNLDFDRYHFIFVLGDKLEPQKIFGEQEVLDGIIKYGNNITFGEFLEKA